MHDQPKYQPLEASSFFADNSRVAAAAARHGRARPVAGRRRCSITGKVDDEPADRVSVRDRRRGDGARPGGASTPSARPATAGPAPATASSSSAATRGRRRSHDRTRARRRRSATIFDVITNGFGAMPDHAAQIKVRDRWAIVAYVRALQASASATHRTTSRRPSAARAGGPAGNCRLVSGNRPIS